MVQIENNQDDDKFKSQYTKIILNINGLPHQLKQENTRLDLRQDLIINYLKKPELNIYIGKNKNDKKKDIP